MKEPAAGGGRRYTRRRVLAGGAVIGGAVIAGGYGRFALGDQFEHHVADLLGAPVEVVTPLLTAARERIGSVAYEARASAFLAATTFPGRQLLPSWVRRGAVDALIENILSPSSGNLTYLGIRQPIATFDCTGLVVPR